MSRRVITVSATSEMKHKPKFLPEYSTKGMGSHCTHFQVAMCHILMFPYLCRIFETFSALFSTLFYSALCLSLFPISCFLPEPFWEPGWGSVTSPGFKTKQTGLGISAECLNHQEEFDTSLLSMCLKVLALISFPALSFLIRKVILAAALQVCCED